jgi:hypothetical protein
MSSPEKYEHDLKQPSYYGQMSLKDLDPMWAIWVPGNSIHHRRAHVNAVSPCGTVRREVPQGINFWCPRCVLSSDGITINFAKRKPHPLYPQGIVGSHKIILWFLGAGVPPEADPFERWPFEHDEVYAWHSISISIHVETECWSGYITKGQVITDQ